MNNMAAIFYSGFDDFRNVNLDDALNGFKNKHLKLLSEKIKKLFAECSIKKANLELEKVPKVCIIGSKQFNPSPNFQSFYSGFVLLEINIPENDDSEIILKVESIPFTYCWFYHLYEPSTIVVLVRVNSSFDDYYKAIEQVAKYYQNSTGLNIDYDFEEYVVSFFTSYQPEIYINPDCEEFNVDLGHTKMKLEIN